MSIGRSVQEGAHGIVIWLTGLSGSGKSAICDVLYERLKPRMPELVRLDGDAVREAFGNDLGHTEADRVRQVMRVQRLARLLSSQGLAVIVSVVYARPDLLAWNRREMSNYVEVLVDAPLEVVRARDPKGLYRRAALGEIGNVVGHDIPWHRPETPDLVLDSGGGTSVVALAERVIRSIPALGALWSARADG